MPKDMTSNYYVLSYAIFRVHSGEYLEEYNWHDPPPDWGMLRRSRCVRIFLLNRCVRFFFQNLRFFPS